jgi:hypothetical protein
MYSLPTVTTAHSPSKLPLTVVSSLYPVTRTKFSRLLRSITAFDATAGVLFLKHWIIIHITY